MSKRASNPGRPQGEAGRQDLERMNRSHRPLRDWAFSQLQWTPGLRILDVGCGGGAAISEMLELSPGSVIHGADYMQTSIQCAGDNNRTWLGERVFLHRCDVTALPFEAGTFDLVTVFETVYFWPDIRRAMEELRRVLRPGGRLLVACEACDPDDFHWDPVEDIHFVVYRREELAAILEESGFRQVESHRGQGQYITVTGLA